MGPVSKPMQACHKFTRTIDDFQLEEHLRLARHIINDDLVDLRANLHMQAVFFS